MSDRKLGIDLPKSVKDINGDIQLARRLNDVASQLFYNPPIGFIITNQAFQDHKPTYVSYRMTITDMEVFAMLRNELWFIWFDWAVSKKFDWLNNINGGL